MNSLVKELIQPLLEATSNTVALYPGKFKPPHKGHFAVAKQLLDKADKVIIVISPITVDGVTAQQSEAVWNLYSTLLGDKLDIKVANGSPVKYVLDTIKENPEGNFIVAYGKGEEDRYKSLVNNPNIQIVDGGTISDEEGNLNATDFRNALQTNQDISRFLPDGIYYKDFLKAVTSGTLEELSDKELKFWALHANVFDALKKNPDHMYEILKNKLTGDKLEALEYFYRTYFTQSKPLQENCGCQHSQPTDFKGALVSLTKYMIDKGMDIMPLPKLKIIDNDVKNAKNILGRTAYYNPEDCSITLFTFGRHPKDILRSYAHEMIHRIQDNEGRLGNVNTTNTNEGGDLDQLEREAYEHGNMTFRNWEDGIKNQKYIKEYKEYALNELFEKDLPNIEKISGYEYKVGNENDIEAIYYFRLEDSNGTWSIHWKFTDNNKNTSPEAWKQITATSYKILKDFINNRHPKSIIISGNTESKTNIYKSKSFLEKLENIFNDEYKIDNSDEDKVVMNLIENIYQSSIKKRMETLDESYEQALHYWQNGDINSKSKIERWNSIKRKTKREVLQELYKIKNV